MITIRRVPSLEHNFQLVVTKVYDEGDQELLEDEDESEPFTSILNLPTQTEFIKQPTRKDHSSSVKNSSSEQTQPMANPLSFGVISTATLMSSSSLSPPERMPLLKPSSRLACTALCMKGNTGEVRSKPKIPIWKSSFGSALILPFVPLTFSS